jgi:hypothetical protein
MVPRDHMVQERARVLGVRKLLRVLRVIIHMQAETLDHGKHVIVASEPSTYKDKEWTLVEKNRAVLVGPTGEVKIEGIKYPGDDKVSL